MMNMVKDRGCVNQEYLPDVAGTDEGRRKGKTPKGEESCSPSPWAYGEELYDCHLEYRWSAIAEGLFCAGALYAGVLIHRKSWVCCSDRNGGSVWQYLKVQE